jgi:arylformamidase
LRYNTAEGKNFARSVNSMKFGRIIDITRMIHPGTAIWPGDKSVQLSRDSSISAGGSCNLSSISLGLHTGTHVDAPYHFVDSGVNLDNLDLSSFIGYVKIFDLKNINKCKTKKYIEALPIEENDIVFLKTSNSNISEDDPFCWTFIYIDITAAEYLVEKRVKCIGIDYLSVEQYASKNHETHLMLLGAGMGIIEGLNLSCAGEGRYFFSCLPLKISGAEGSPARAVLMELED